MKKTFASLVKYALVFVYLVIVAGALVRMTGSGMGCPDWPKCFGYYIPPTDEATLQWSPDRTFKKGQVIIKDEQLLIAKDDFTTGTDFEASHWKPYTKHDYATFNVYHTWTEYINRLCGALAGIVCFAMAIWSFAWRKEKKWVVVLSWLVVFMMGFQAWLGAKVVESVLSPVKITTHMMVAVIIVAMILLIMHLIKEQKKQYTFNKLFQYLIWVGLAASIVQIYLGTQVRQFVDVQVKQLGYDNMQEVLVNPDWHFYFHRTFSIMVVLIILWSFIINKKKQLGYTSMNWILLVLILEVISGMAMYYLHFPFGMQTTHLVFAVILFGIQFYMILQFYGSKKLENQ